MDVKRHPGATIELTWAVMGPHQPSFVRQTSATDYEKTAMGDELGEAYVSTSMDQKPSDQPRGERTARGIQPVLNQRLGSPH